MAIIRCPECGKEISNQAKVCINCGYRLRTKSYRKKQRMKRKIKKYAPKVAIVFGGIIFLLLIWRIALPNLFTPVDELLAKGKYVQAYRKTHDKDKRELILMENQIAVACLDVSNSMVDPTSFRLLEAAYIMDRDLLLSVSGKNAFGNIVTNIWCYSYEGEGKYTYALSFSDFELNDGYDGESLDEMTERTVENLMKLHIQEELMTGLYTILPDESVNRINKQFAQGKLDDIKLIPRPKLTPEPDVTSTASPKEQVD